MIAAVALLASAAATLPSAAVIVLAVREEQAIENDGTTSCFGGCDYWSATRGTRVRGVNCTHLAAGTARCTFETNLCTVDQDRDGNGWCARTADLKHVGYSIHGRHFTWSIASTVAH